MKTKVKMRTRADPGGEAGLWPSRDISTVGLLPDARAQYLTPPLTAYQTDWTEIGRRLADAMTAEIAHERGARVQVAMPVEFSPGESVHRIGEDA
jgi:DNA-binding LacI/PurR family transcriptional regulator